MCPSDYPMPFYANENQEKKFFGPDLTQGIHSTLNSLSSGRIIDHTPYTAPVSVNSNNDHSNNKSRNGYNVHYSTPGSGGEIPTDSTASPSEHLYDLPLIRSSIDSPSPTEGLHLLPSAAGGSSLHHASVGGGSMRRPNLEATGSPETTLEKHERSASPLSFVSDATSGEKHVKETGILLGIVNPLYNY